MLEKFVSFEINNQEKIIGGNSVNPYEWVQYNVNSWPENIVGENSVNPYEWIQ